MPLIAVEMEDTLNEVLEEHGEIPGQEEVNQMELGWKGREGGGGGERERERENKDKNTCPVYVCKPAR